MRPETAARAAMPLDVHALENVVLGVGRGVATAHCGELFQGQIRDSSGALRRCLLSLPCPALSSRVTFLPDGGDTVTVEPGHKVKVRAVVQEALAHLNVPCLGGRVVVESNIAAGKGYGSSTADCVATVRAIAHCWGRRLTSEQIALLTVRAETASDTSMFDHAILFAQREGVVLEDFARPIARLEVLGIDTDPNAVVDTLVYPPAAYSRADIAVFDTLLPALRRAVRTEDVALLGRVATASAIVNERFLPKRLFAEIHRIMTAAAGLGLAAAHSGTVLSILLDPARADLERTVEGLRETLATIGITDVFRFQTPGPRVRKAEA